MPGGLECSVLETHDADGRESRENWSMDLRGSSGEGGGRQEVP